MSEPADHTTTDADADAAPTGIAIFDTAIGHCSLAWGPRGLVGVQLPEADGSAEAKRARMARDFPPLAEMPEPQRPPAVRAAVDAIVALLSDRSAADPVGVDAAVLAIVLDEEGVPPFHRRVYDIARRIPPGETKTYGEVAEALGDKTLARAVGQALGANPFAPVVPCHRVLGAKGWQGGFSAPGGPMLKLRMLAIEGAAPSGQPSLFDER
ncbi:Methylated-DNA--protein-cysteine methyltransferase [Xylophilus ampelinus]|nr:methylated-DNA--[protein]-cysteine S-methyltransferase [Variovorax sp.]VTY38326.1 Methylated-DNA--protein-cysteine methyltransferase [Xylophilus ampelinus]